MANNVVSNLSQFLKEDFNSAKLYALLAKKAPSINLFHRETADGDYTINKVLTVFNGTIADATECGAANNLETKISQRRLSIAYMKFDQEICTNNFLKAYTSWQTRFEGGETTIPFEAEFVNDQLSQIADVVEKSVWQDITVGGNTFRGLQYIIATEAPAPITTAAVGIIGKIDDLIAAVPNEYVGKMEIYMSRADFMQFILALKNANMFDSALFSHDATIDTFTYLNYTIHGVPGIAKYNGNSYAYMLYPENVVVATTSGNDHTDMSVIDKEWDETLLFRSKFGYGKQIAFPNEEVLSVQL